jgi:hypothetical protein
MGKMIILVVLGSYFILGTIMINNGNVATDTVDNVVDYYSRANAKHIASSGANLALGKIAADLSWNTGYHDVDFSGGKMNVDIISDTTIGPNGLQIFSTSDYQGYKDSVIVEIARTYYSRYLMYIHKNPGGYYVTGDTMNGPFWSDDQLWTKGKPVFKGRVFLGKGVKKETWKSDPAEPQFWGGYEYVKPEAAMLGSMSGLSSEASARGFNTDKELWLTLNNNNTVSYRFTKTGTDSTILLSEFAPNSVIFSSKDIHLQGKIDGSLTVVSNKNIWLDDDVGVVDDPKVNPSSTEMLGIVANSKIYVTDNPANNDDINITAAMYTNTSFEAENYGSRPIAGHINLYGSLTQNTDGYTGVISGTSLIHGFNLNYSYDWRYFTSAPPLFPLTDRMQVLRWWE